VSTGALDDADDRYSYYYYYYYSLVLTISQTPPAFRRRHADAVSVPVRPARQPASGRPTAEAGTPEAIPNTPASTKC
jgi:hypothetical protein